MRTRLAWMLAGVCLSVAVAGLLAAASAEKPKTAWEYKFVTAWSQPPDPDNGSDSPNVYGAEGWELVSATMEPAAQPPGTSCTTSAPSSLVGCASAHHSGRGVLKHTYTTDPLGGTMRIAALIFSLIGFCGLLMLVNVEVYHFMPASSGPEGGLIDGGAGFCFWRHRLSYCFAVCISTFSACSPAPSFHICFWHGAAWCHLLLFSSSFT